MVERTKRKCMEVNGRTEERTERERSCGFVYVVEHIERKGAGMRETERSGAE